MKVFGVNEWLPRRCWWRRSFDTVTPVSRIWGKSYHISEFSSFNKMGTMAYQITTLTIVYSTAYSGVDQKKHRSPSSLVFVRGIHRWPVNSPHKWPVTRKMFPFDDVIIFFCLRCIWGGIRLFVFKMPYLCGGISRWVTILHICYMHFNIQVYTCTLDYTEKRMSLFCRICQRWQHRNRSFWQHPLKSMMKIPTIWRHCRFSVDTVYDTRTLSFHMHMSPV